MSANEKAGSSRKPRSLRRWGGWLMLLAIGLGVNSGCSSLFHKDQPRQQLTNPWFKPAKKESEPSWVTKMFYKEKPQPKNPSEWLSQPRPE